MVETQLCKLRGTSDAFVYLQNMQKFRVQVCIAQVLQNSQKFRVLWHGRTEITEVPGRYENAVPVPRVLWHGRTDLTEVPGTGMNVIQNSKKFFVRVWMLYRTHRSSAGTGSTRVNTRPRGRSSI